ncbi:signal peptide peptidase SppA [Sphingomonas solaris]|uniref:Signal peptide peptidase SppA n=1 Tax=Alterirhizorhabdus solaris TaxID=2529389 RepID=A0A558QVR6_9SPHN|nr:signal peptide peptidase SppA [Sphingomonas solaris]TVV71231.1 signal peptide peptidase SppA [Sphingomonas solaris]
MRIVRGLWRLLVGIKDGLVLLAMLLFFGVLFAALSFSPNPRVPGSGALLVDLDGQLVEQPAQTDPFTAIAGRNPVTREYRLRDVIRAIDGAATDASVKVVVLELDRFTGGGQATIAEAARAVDRVRAKGKPVLAFATGYTDDGYQLAAHASELWLDPFGAVLLTGPGGANLYYKGLLDKLGVETKVYRVGQFKSAVEPFIRTDQSPAAKAAAQALADSLWAAWRADVGAARPKARLAGYIADPEAAMTAAGGGMARAAEMAGLVDRLGDRIAFGRRVAELAGKGTDKQAGAYAAIPLDRWLAAHPERSGGPQVGVLTIAGTIVDGEAPPGTAGGETIAALLLDELAKDRIKALVVRVDSPGGSVTASERIRTAILEAKRKGLPVVVSMGAVAASGGYWVSTPADRIFAEPSTITGSIGVFGLLPTFKGTLAKLGLSADGVKTTPLSGEPDLLRGTSPEFDRLLQAGITDVYGRFTGLVAASRHLPVARVDQIAQGRVWAGSTARGIGLVDAYGGLDVAIAEAARRAKLDPAKVSVRDIEKQPTMLSQIIGDLTSERGESGPTDAFSRAAARPVAALRRAILGVGAIADGPAIQVMCLECPAAAAPRGHDTGMIGLAAEWLARP